MSKFADNNFTGESPEDITRENSGQISGDNSGQSSGESSGENSRENSGEGSTREHSREHLGKNPGVTSVENSAFMVQNILFFSHLVWSK